MLRKTVILTDDNKHDKAIATLVMEQNSKGAIAKLKAYKIPNKSQRFVLGVAIDGKQVAKQNVCFGNYDTYEFRINDVSLDRHISCVMVTDDKTKSPVVWGTTAKIIGYKNRMLSAMRNENIVKPKLDPIQPVVDKHDEEVVNIKKEEAIPLFEQPTAKELNSLIDDTLAQSKKFDLFEDILSNEDQGNQFFHSIKGQIDELFEQFPQDRQLEELVPGSRWVRVDYEADGREFVLGLIYEDDQIKYIAYGVPGDYNAEPPSFLAPYSQWLPSDTNNPYGQGYWVVYQDAQLGNNVELDQIS